jgi:hypothetical protein
MPTPKDQGKVAYGDFQTPLSLAQQVCARLGALGVAPRSVVEPTCGVGAFLTAAQQHFPTLAYLLGMDINPAYIAAARQTIQPIMDKSGHVELDLAVGDFFLTDWEQRLASLPDPILFLGNPPWVTNSELSTLSSDNLPVKQNFQQREGIEAITGASNFDISEWMLLQMTALAERRRGVVAMLCKTNVARKTLLHFWQKEGRNGQGFIFKIDANVAFNVSVDACLFVFDASRPDGKQSCPVYESLEAAAPAQSIGFRDNRLASDVDWYDRWRHLAHDGRQRPNYQWRSGIKHDAAAIMELTEKAAGYQNKLGETWELEKAYLFPMLKSSDIAGGSCQRPRLTMLVPQQSVGQETTSIRLTAPTTWQYLNAHSHILDNRKSKIYRNRPRFSIFGVGDYSFAPWKVAISGMYKELNFKVVGPSAGRPTVLDDTCYFIPCHTQDEAEFLAELLNAAPAQQFYASLIFWEEKRPITVRLLKSLDIGKLAVELDVSEKLAAFCGQTNGQADYSQPRLLE